MPKLTIEYQDENRRLASEQAIAFIAHMRQTANDALGLAIVRTSRTALREGAG